MQPRNLRTHLLYITYGNVSTIYEKQTYEKAFPTNAIICHVESQADVMTRPSTKLILNFNPPHIFVVV